MTQGFVCIVDDADAELVAQYRWRIRFARGGKTYAVRTLSTAERRGGTTTEQRMSRFLLGLGRPGLRSRQWRPARQFDAARRLHGEYARLNFPDEDRVIVRYLPRSQRPRQPRPPRQTPVRPCWPSLKDGNTLRSQSVLERIRLRISRVTDDAGVEHWQWLGGVASAGWPRRGGLEWSPGHLRRLNGPAERQSVTSPWPPSPHPGGRRDPPGKRFVPTCQVERCVNPACYRRPGFQFTPGMDELDQGVVYRKQAS